MGKNGKYEALQSISVFPKNLINSVIQEQEGKILFIIRYHRVLEYYQVCSNDDPGLTLTYFMARSDLVPYVFVWEIGNTGDSLYLKVQGTRQITWSYP